MNGRHHPIQPAWYLNLPEHDASSALKGFDRFREFRTRRNLFGNLYSLLVIAANANRNKLVLT